MKKTQPLDDLEIFELIRLAYPDKFKDDTDETWDKVMEFVEQINGFDDIAGLLGRVVMLSIPMYSELSEKSYHCLGKVELDNGIVRMCADVKREVL